MSTCIRVCKLRNLELTLYDRFAVELHHDGSVHIDGSMPSLDFQHQRRIDLLCLHQAVPPKKAVTRIAKHSTKTFQTTITKITLA